jgi:hypothetical protein
MPQGSWGAVLLLHLLPLLSYKTRNKCSKCQKIPKTESIQFSEGRTLPLPSLSSSSLRSSSSSPLLLFFFFLLPLRTSKGDLQQWVGTRGYTGFDV